MTERTWPQSVLRSLGAAACLSLVMCGAGVEREPAASPASAASADESGAAGAAAPPPPPAAAPSIAQPEPTDAPHRRAAALVELERAQSDLQAAASDCVAVCRALSSMERATQHLCDLAADPDDRRRCEDARRRLLSARDTIRSVCGGCP